MNQDLLTAVQVFCDSSTTADDATLAIPLLEAVPSTCSLPEFVEGIGQMLTSTDNLIRRRATQLLFLLVSEKAAESLARPQQLAIVQFFSARLADFPSVEPALGALRFLVTEYDSIAADAAPVVCAGMFDNLNITDMEQKLRQLCFGLLETLLSRQDTLEALVAQGPAFVSGFIESMEGEKDPRCLVVCLRTAATILGAFDSVLDDDLIEELFDVTACYFPITFTPPPNDPFGISKQSLVLALRSVFTASPLLCPLVVPVLLEKLSSSLVEAKMNSLQTLIAGVPVYGIEPLLEFVPDIRDALQNEVHHVEDEAVQALALEAIVVVGACVARHTESTHDQVPWSQFHVPLMGHSLAEFTRAPDAMRARAAAKIQAALARTGGFAMKGLLAETLPALDKAMEAQGSNRSSQRAACMRLMVELVRAVDPALDFPRGGHPMQAHVESLHRIFTSSLMEDNTTQRSAYEATEDRMAPTNEMNAHTERRIASAEGLALLATRPPSRLLSDEAIADAVQALTSVVTDTSSLSVRRACIDALRAIAHKSSDLASVVIRDALPLLLDQSVVHAKRSGDGSDKTDDRRTPTVASTFLPDIVHLAAGESLLFKHVLGELMLRITHTVSPPAGDEDMTGDTSDGDAPASLRLHRMEHAAPVVEAMAELVEGSLASVECMKVCAVRTCTLAPPRRASDSESDPSSYYAAAARQPSIIPTLIMSLVEHPAAKGGSSDTEQAELRGYGAVLTATERILRQAVRHGPSAESAALATDILGLLEAVSGHAEDAQLSDAFHPIVDVANCDLLFPSLAAAALCGPTLPNDSVTVRTIQHLLASLANAATTWDSTVRGGPLEHLDMWTLSGAATGSNAARAVQSTTPLAEICGIAIASALYGLPKSGGAEGVLQRVSADVINTLAQNIADEAAPLRVRQGHVRALGWVLRSLSLKGVKTASDATDRLLQLVIGQSGATAASTKSIAVAATAASALATALADSGEFLSTAAGTRKNPLYQQRLFSTLFRQLKVQMVVPDNDEPSAAGAPSDAASKQDDGRFKRGPAIPVNHPQLDALLLTVCGLVSALDDRLLMMHLEDLMPWVLFSLQAKDPSVAVDSLFTFNVLLRHALSAVEDHLHSLVPRLLELARSVGRPAVRVAALNCLLSLTDLPYHKLHPVRTEVVRVLSDCLDDPKRAVRRRAVVARNAWYAAMRTGSGKPM